MPLIEDTSICTSHNTHKPHNCPSTDKAFLCHTCGQNFENYMQLSRHMSEHTGCGSGGLVVGGGVEGTSEGFKNTDRAFQCHECKQVFTMFDQLKVIFLLLFFLPSFFFLYFSSLSLLNSKYCYHFHSLINFEISWYFLPKTQTTNPTLTTTLTFNNNALLQTHVRNHVQLRNFACDVCSAAFSHRSNLSRHKQQHCSAKKYQCDQCGKGWVVWCSVVW